jgi:hypothetical protein
MARTFYYPVSDRIDPAGSNDLSALAMFYQRSLYKEVIYPLSFPAPQDTWYDKNLYGKVDSRQNVILLKNEKIDPVLTIQRERIYAADFVVTAFEAFSEHMALAALDGKLDTITTEGNLFNISAAEGWSCPRRTYSHYVENLFRGFIQYYVKSRHEEIEDFRTYIDVIKAFLKTSARILPVTMTNAILTNMVSPMVSGLSIKINSFDAGDDTIKYEKFISNPNFDFYRKVAKKYGFIVNKNMPWILTADLFSDAMIAYMQQESPQSTKNSFFRDYYSLACLEDIDNIKNIFVNFYNQYRDINPHFEKKEMLGPRCSYKTKVELVYRWPATMNDLDSLMTDFDWIDFYLDLREIESEGTPLKKDLIRRVARDHYEIFQFDPMYQPLEGAIRYINGIYRGYVYSPGYLINLTTL